MTLAQHIEGLIESAQFVKYGPNWFLEIGIKKGMVLINEFVPEAERTKETSFQTTGVFKCHFGEWTQENVNSLLGQGFAAEARPHKIRPNTYYFTQNVVFAPHEITPEEQVKLEEAIAPEEIPPEEVKAPEINSEDIPKEEIAAAPEIIDSGDLPEAIEDAPIVTEVKTSKSKGPARCPDCGQVLSKKKEHHCKKAKVQATE